MFSDDIGSHFLSSAFEHGEVVYFDTAGRSILPKAVYEVGQRALAQKLTPWLGVGSEDDPAAVRSLFATLIGADTADDVAIMPSTAFAMTLAARNIARTGALRSGSTVLVMENEMGSVVYPWQEACRVVGASFKVILDPQPPLSWSDVVIAALVDDRSIAVIALPHVHWCDGSRVDLIAISKHLERMPEDTRPLLVVDGTQSIGALPFNLKDFPVKPAFIACSVHKWLNGPYGLSLVYVSPVHHVEWGPLDQHERSRLGSNQADWDEVGAMDRDSGCYPEQFFQGARRFDAGGKPNPLIVPMVREALQLLTLKWSPHAIQSYLMSLTDSIATQLETLLGSSVVVIKPKSLRSGHILGLRLLDPTSGASVLSEVHRRLKEHRVYVSVRSGWLRVSPYIYNTPSEANAFVSILVGVTRSIFILRIPPLLHVVPRERPSYKLLLTGSTGWLGQFVYKHFLSHGRSLTVYAAYSCKNIPFWVPVEYRVQLDLTSDSSAAAAIESIRPDMIIHTAAITSPNVCHDDPARAYQVNNCRALVEAVRTTVPDCLFVFTSTDMVYDGFQPPYLESAAALSCPINVYGATKLACESQVTQLRRGVVLRLSNMIGPSFVYKAFGGDKFLQWLFKAFQMRSFVGLKDREVRSFVWVQDVVALINTIAEMFMRAPAPVAVETPVLNLNARDGLDESALDVVLRSSGKIYNVGGPLPLSRLSLAARMSSLLGVDLHVICASDTSNELHHFNSSTWKVHIMNSPLRPSDVTAVVTAGGVASFTQLHSPLDITMDSTSTEKAFSFRFTDLNEALLQCCHL